MPPELALLAAALLASLAAVAFLDLFFHTETGIAMGALGDNEAAVVQAGVNPAGLAGPWASSWPMGLPVCREPWPASYQGFADVNFGAGVIAAGLASVMLGELVLRSQFHRPAAVPRSSGIDTFPRPYVRGPVLGLPSPA